MGHFWPKSMDYSNYFDGLYNFHTSLLCAAFWKQNEKVEEKLKK